MHRLEPEDAKAHCVEPSKEVENGAAADAVDQGISNAQVISDQERCREIAEAIEVLRRYRREHNITLGDTTFRERIQEGRE